MTKLRRILTVAAVLVALVLPIIPTGTVLGVTRSLHWVGDGGNWSDTAHWSLASGGVGGELVPDADDDVYFDAGSFTIPGQTVTVDVNAICQAMDWTGATNTPELFISSTLTIHGSLVAISAMTHSGSGNMYFVGHGGSVNITWGQPAVYSWTNRMEFGYTSAGTWVFQDALNNGTSRIEHISGTLDTNGKTVTCGAFDGSSITARTLTLGASTVNCTSWDASGANLTLTANTATIKVTGTGSFLGGGMATYNAVELNGTAHTVTGNNTFASLAFKPSGAQVLTFTGTTQTFAAMSRTGTGQITITDGAFTKTGGGTVSLNNVTVSGNTGSPAATFYGMSASRDSLGNTDWTFPLTVSTQAASGVAMTAAGVTSGLFNGTLTDMGGANDTVWFEYGLTAAYGSTTAPVAKTVPAAFTAAIPTGLTPGATYHFRAKMDNGTTTAVGADQSFTLTMPTVTTSAVSGQSLSGLDGTVTLNGNVTNLGSAASAYVRFEYGATTSYGASTATSTVAAIGAMSTGLTFHIIPNQLYHYRSVATVGATTVYGSDQTFIFSGGGAAGYGLLQNVLTLIMAAGILFVGLKSYNGNPVATVVLVAIGLLGIVLARAILF